MIKYCSLFIKELLDYDRCKTILLLVLSFFSSLLGGVSIIILVPMLSVIGQESSSLTSFIPEWFNTIEVKTKFLLIMLIYIIIMITKQLVIKCVAWLEVDLSEGATMDVSLSSLQNIFACRWEVLAKEKSGNLLNLFMTEIPKYNSGLLFGSKFVVAVINGLIQYALALLIAPLLTLLVTIMAAMFLPLMKKTNQQSKSLGERFRIHYEDWANQTKDIMTGMKEIRANNAVEEQMKISRELLQKRKENLLAFTSTRQNFAFLYQIVLVLMIAITVYVAFFILHIQMDELLIVIVIFGRLWPIFSSLQSYSSQIYNLVPTYEYVKKINQYLKENCESGVQGNCKINKLTLNKEIFFEDVVFAYQEDLKKILDGVCFSIPAKSIVALTGASGAGKSTLVDLLLGFFDPQSGHITVDGTQLNSDNFNDWRGIVSYVPQDPVLFHGTIKENLLRYGTSATEAEIRTALKATAVWDEIQTFSRGLETVVGDRGAALSGGQKQRIILARALLAKPRVLILDEATSALDLENENLINCTLQYLKKAGVSIFIIAHRESTIQAADHVLHLSEGKIQ